MAARGAPVWQQTYPTDDWEVTHAIVERAQRAGCSAIVLTVDNHWPRYNETLARAMRQDPRNCTDCHVNNSHDFVRKAPIYQGVDISRVKESTQPSATTWEYLDRVRGLVKGKLLVKGIMRGDEAAGCARHGADGVIISNHGGRDEESLRSTIECLPEVVAACRVPVLVDGGIRRGTDVFKALALGASAVGIGRPQIWGLAPLRPGRSRGETRHLRARAACHHAPGRHTHRRFYHTRFRGFAGAGAALRRRPAHFNALLRRAKPMGCRVARLLQIRWLSR